MDFVEGVSFIFWEVFFNVGGPNTRNLWGDLRACPIGNFANLGSLKCNFLYFDIISEVGCSFLQYEPENNQFHSKNSEMFRNDCVHFDSFRNKNIKITCRVDEWTRN